jgi:hypothetical protein
VDYLHDLRCADNLKEAYVLAQHIVESYERYLERSDQPALTPFWELRLTERLTLALYLERSSAGTLSADQLLSYITGSKLLEGARLLRERNLITPAVEDLLSPLHLKNDARVNFRTTALAADALSILDEKNHDLNPPSLLGKWN